MKRGFLTLLWLLLVIVLSAVLLSFLERQQERQEYQASEEKPKAEVFLIAYEGGQFPGLEQSGSYLRVGCADMLVPYDIPVTSPRLPSVLTALTRYEPPPGLHNPLQEKGITFRELQEDEKGRMVVFIEGKPSFGGICDTPRFKAQFEGTLKLYLQKKKFEIRLNGDAKAYRCIDDLSGRCK